MESIWRIADRVAMLYQGRLLEVGSPEDIQKSTNPVVRQFIKGDIDGPIQIT
jgi:phospholipid/cholesterol/gamma-HCH transport system ATP-binding protein